MNESNVEQNAFNEPTNEKGVIGQFMDMAKEELEPLHALNPSAKEKTDELSMAPQEADLSDVNMESLRAFLNNMLEGQFSSVQIEEKYNNYTTAHSKEDMAAFILNDLKEIYENDPEMVEEILSYLERIFNMLPEDITVRAQYVEENNIKPGQMTVRENHGFIRRILRKLLGKFKSSEVDYYLSGSLPCYMATGATDERYYDNIDIMLNEIDIEKVRALLEGTEFSFNDNRLNTNKVMDQNSGIPMGHHEISANYTGLPFQIQFTPFERGLDHEVIRKDYFKDDMGSLKVYKHMISPELSQLLYDDHEHFYDDIGYKMVSLENLYYTKYNSMNMPGREQDKKDMSVLLQSGQLDPNKLQAIGNAPRLAPTIEPASLSNNMSKDSNDMSRPFYMKSNAPFDQRSNEEIQIAGSIREKNQAIGQKKREQELAQKPKILTLQKMKNTPLGQKRGAVDITILIISTVSIAVAFTMLLEFLTR